MEENNSLKTQGTFGPTIPSKEENIKKLESMRDSKIIFLTMDESRNIDRFLVDEVYDLMEKISEDQTINNLDVIIHSFGGDADAAYHIAKILRSYCKGKLTFIVPRFAKSAATLLCCSGDLIIMGKPSELGPVDPQRLDIVRGVRYSGLSIKDTIRFLDSMEKDLNKNSEKCNKVISEAIRNLPLMEIGDSLRALNHIADYLTELLSEGMFSEELKNSKENTENNIKNIIFNLVTKHNSHSKCIDYNTAKKIGLKVKEAEKEEWKVIWDIFKQFEKEASIK